MAAGKLTVEMIRKALRAQSHGGKLGRFYVQRTFQHLQQCNDYFKEDIKEIKANVSLNSGHAFRRFAFENIPQLKYRNPKIVFNCNLNEENLSDLTILYADGSETKVNIDQKQTDIYNELIKATKEN